MHEIPSPLVFFRETAHALKQHGKLLLLEPAGHVTRADFERELNSAVEAGFRAVSEPAVRGSRAAVLSKA